MKRIISLALTGCILFAFASCAKTEPDEPVQSAMIVDGLDYYILVNKTHKLPDEWEGNIETVTVTNSVDDTVEVEKRTYDAYLLLKDDLEKNDGIYLELDSGRRSVAAQQEIMDRYIKEYGADYAAKTVAQPGFSEHHTGLAIDLYFRIKDDDGNFKDVYYNQDLVQYPEIWAKIHSKLADYGFILRYLEGREHITGYGYEPWHLRYIYDVDTAKDIMSKDITFEEYLGAVKSVPVTEDLGESGIYSNEDLKAAMVQVKCQFAYLEGCELHAIRYGGDEAVNEENLAWLNSLEEGTDYKELMKFVIDFNSPTEGEQKDYEFWLVRNDKGGWDIVSSGRKDKRMANDIQIETVTTDSCSMNYFKFGKGAQTLIIIPGLSVQSVMGSAELVADAYAPMADDFTIYVFDRRSDLPDTYSVDDMARDTAEAIKKLGLSKVDIFGASQGGMIAMKIAIDNPDLVNKLVLGSTSAKIGDNEFDGVKAWVDLARKGDAEALYLAFGEAIYPTEIYEQSKDLLIQVAKTVTEEDMSRFVILAEGMKGFDVTADLNKITCPVLVIGSSDDRVLGSEASELIAECMKGKDGFEIYMYEGFGHAAYDTAPDYKDRLMKFFLSK